MNSRMDKYEEDTPALKKRTEKNADLYKSVELGDYDKFDINSNVSVLKSDARKIDVDQIRDMLDKKYRDNVPQRKSIAIDINDLPAPSEKPEDTKEYDINSILQKAKTEKNVNYDVERLNKVNNSDLDFIDEINKKYTKPENTNKNVEEQELKELINTITALEMKNKVDKDADLLNLAGDDSTKTIQINSGDSKQAVSEDNSNKESDFYTGKLAVKDEDFDDFKDMQNDIKSNSVVIKILIFILILVALAVGVIIVNKYLNLGLF